jgi:hypothetical protein
LEPVERVGIDAGESSFAPRADEPALPAGAETSGGSGEWRRAAALALAFGVATLLAAGPAPWLAFAVAGAAFALLAIDRPGWLLAIALNGFYLYLLALDLAGRHPYPGSTVPYYALLGSAMVAATLRMRGTLVARLAARDRAVSFWIAAALLLAFWFLVSAALFRDGGTLTRNLAGLLVLSSLPAAALAFSLHRRDVASLRTGIVALGLLFCAIDVIGVVLDTNDVRERFSPIDSLDPISAGLIPAIAAAAALSYSPTTRAQQGLWVAVLSVLGAAVIVAGSRGPVVSLAVVAVVAALLRPRRLPHLAVAAVSVVVIGVTAGSQLGTTAYLGQGSDGIGTVIPGVPTKTQPEAGAPAPEGAGTEDPAGEVVGISTTNMRRHWIVSALKAVPDRPLLGHGVGALKDTSAESEALGTYGQRIYPHNDLVESVYSLGIPGGVLFAIFLVVPFAVLLLARRSRDAVGGRGRFLLAATLLSFAFVQSNFSGEIGADSLLWASAALSIAFWLDTRRTAHC